jgi:hypothetical protein
LALKAGLDGMEPLAGGATRWVPANDLTPQHGVSSRGRRPGGQRHLSVSTAGGCCASHVVDDCSSVGLTCWVR